ncbi:hypothetical protein EDD85DRAFT_961890 [Armillaria nabsnona]|nr:hypothetical protein EDD85DRAFT_961890 [Armillaria nabsnona]
MPSTINMPELNIPVSVVPLYLTCGHDPLFFRLSNDTATSMEASAISVNTHRYLLAQLQHSLRRTEKSAHKICRTRKRLLDSLDVVESWSCDRLDLLRESKSNLWSAEWPNDSSEEDSLSSLSSLEGGLASVLTDIGSPPANEAVAVACHAESNIAPSIQAMSSPLESCSEAQSVSSNAQATGTNPTSKLPTDGQNQADKLASSTVASNTDGEVDGLSWCSAHEIEDADEQKGLIRLQDIALWSNLIFLNIRKTKARILHGCKIANRTKISDWDLIPSKGEHVCDRCTNLYPCEYMTIGDTVKCHECRINGKGCLWAGHADVIIDDDTFIESNVGTARLSLEAESKTQSNMFQCVAAQFVGRYTRTNTILLNEDVLNTEINEAQTADAKASPHLGKHLPAVLLPTVGEIATQSGRDKKFGATMKNKKSTNIESVPSPGLMTRSKLMKDQLSQVNQKETSDGSVFANSRKCTRKDSLTTRDGEPSSQGSGEKNKESISFMPPRKRPRNWGPNFSPGITLRPEQSHRPADGAKLNPLKKSEVTIRPDQLHGPDEGATLKPLERPLLTQSSSKASDARVPRGPKPDTPTVSVRNFASSSRSRLTPGSTGNVGGGPGYHHTDGHSLPPPMSATQVINVVGLLLNTLEVHDMFHRREQVLEDTRATVQAMELGDLVERATKILVDYAELTLTVESIDQKWGQAIQMQREIIEVVLKRFNSFQTELLNDVANVKRKWVEESED